MKKDFDGGGEAGFGNSMDEDGNVRDDGCNDDDYQDKNANDMYKDCDLGCSVDNGVVCGGICKWMVKAHWWLRWWC